MKEYKIYFVIICLAIQLANSFKAEACSPIPYPSNSMDKVPMKIGNTYFEIPEAYFQYDFDRLPGEQDYISVHYSVIDFSPAGRDIRTNANLIIIKNSVDNDRRRTIIINDNLKAVVSDGMPDNKFGLKKTQKFVRSLISSSKPKNWDMAMNFKQNFYLDETDHCFGKKMRYNTSNALPFSLNYLQQALKIPLSEIRGAAIYYMSFANKKESFEVIKILLNIARNDKSEIIKAKAIYSLKKLKKYDDNLQNEILKLNASNNNEYISNAISYFLSE